MFVLTFNLNKKRAILIIAAAAVLLCVLIFAFGRSGTGSGTVKVTNNEDRVAYLESLGWRVTAEPIAERTIVIPQEFSSVYEAYNELQIAQGFDLREHRGLEVTIYTYEITNYTGYDGNVVADLYVFNYTVIGGDVHSLAQDGFMHGLRRR